MDDLHTIKTEAANRIAAVDTALASSSNENEKRLLNQLRSGLELTQASAEALEALASHSED